MVLYEIYRKDGGNGITFVHMLYNLISTDNWQFYKLLLNAMSRDLWLVNIIMFTKYKNKLLINSVFKGENFMKIGFSSLYFVDEWFLYFVNKELNFVFKSILKRK
jgi:hypothetical protein